MEEAQRQELDMVRQSLGSVEKKLQASRDEAQARGEFFEAQLKQQQQMQEALRQREIELAEQASHQCSELWYGTDRVVCSLCSAPLYGTSTDEAHCRVLAQHRLLFHAHAHNARIARGAGDCIAPGG